MFGKASVKHDTLVKKIIEGNFATNDTESISRGGSHKVSLFDNYLFRNLQSSNLSQQSLMI